MLARGRASTNACPSSAALMRSTCAVLGASQFGCDLPGAPEPFFENRSLNVAQHASSLPDTRRKTHEGIRRPTRRCTRTRAAAKPSANAVPLCRSVCVGQPQRPRDAGAAAAMPLVGGGRLQPYADAQYIDKTDRFRIERRKIRPPVKVRYGVIKPRVYYTSVPQTDHAELEIVSLVVRRSALLQKISEYRTAEAERRPWSKVEALKTLIALRSITLTIVAAVRSWRGSVGERAFLHRGENLLLVLRDDMRDLELLDPPIVFGFDIGRRNPFCLPLVTHRASPPVGGKRLLKRDEEEIARRLASINHDERAQILVEHEYLRREEKRDLRQNKLIKTL